MIAGSLGTTQVNRPRRHSTWVTVLFGALLAADLAPIVLLGLMGGFSRRAWSDPSYPPSFVVVCAATLVSVCGFAGARRGWNALVLSLFGLFMIAWPLFVAWVMLNMLAAAL